MGHVVPRKFSASRQTDKAPGAGVCKRAMPWFLICINSALVMFQRRCTVRKDPSPR